MKTISLLHPFTPKAAGVVESIVPVYHSQPHVKAIRNIAITKGYDCAIEYFTPRWFHYTVKESVLQWNFFPVSITLNGDHKKWTKQASKDCLQHYKKNTPDLTIINMSGQSSFFSYELSKIILANDKKYIAMLGGQQYNDLPWIRDYYRNADHILVHTHMQKSDMETMELFKGLDIRVFPLGVDCDVFLPIEKNNPSPELLYVGRIVEWKRVHLAIEAVNELVKQGFTEAKLNIIGPISSDNYLAELMTMVEKNGLVNNVFFLGHMEHDELPQYFQKADVFLLPSDKETFGMVMIESMACGTPVVAMDCPGGPADVISNNIDGILTTPDYYSKSLFELFRNKELLDKMKMNARKKVLDKYSIEETTRVLFSSIESALT